MADDLSRALIGELLELKAKAKGIAGRVIDGAARDAGGLRQYGMPVFARGITPAGPYMFGPGRLQVAVANGGIAVTPGDLVIGDADGVAVVPAADVDKVAVAPEAEQAHERERLVGLERDVAAIGNAQIIPLLELGVVVGYDDDGVIRGRASRSGRPSETTSKPLHLSADQDRPPRRLCQGR